MSNQELIAELERVRAENAALKARNTSRITLKISEKGGLSVYGMGRFPVTLYRSQWEKLLGMAPQIQEFITANADKLREKTDAPAAPAADAKASLVDQIAARLA